MIHGWKADPQWRKYYEERNEKRDAAVLQRQIQWLKMEMEERLHRAQIELREARHDR